MNNRRKGNSFELEVAKQILATVGPAYDGEDCRRTPSSGGQRFGDRGDLVISNRLFRRFPFVVECKHWKKWRPGFMLMPTKIELDWLEQATKANARSKRPSTPMLIMRGDRQEAWCAAPRFVLRQFLLNGSGDLYCVFPYANVRWLLVPWARALEALRLRKLPFVPPPTRT